MCSLIASPLVVFSPQVSIRLTAPAACLQTLGIPAADIKKLQEAGICTVDGLARTSRRELENIKGLSSAKVDKLHKEGVTSGRLHLACHRHPPFPSAKPVALSCSMDNGTDGLHHSEHRGGNARRENQDINWMQGAR